MSGPFMVVIAALVSAWIALRTSDGLVADDYYKEGLSVGKTIARSERATELGISARVHLTEKELDVSLAARGAGFVLPSKIKVSLSHPTRAGMDTSSVLVRQGDKYVGSLRLPTSGHWLVLVEDDAQTWRLLGSVVLPAAGEIVIGGMEAADIRN